MKSPFVVGIRCLEPVKTAQLLKPKTLSDALFTALKSQAWKDLWKVTSKETPKHKIQSGIRSRNFDGVDNMSHQCRKVQPPHNITNARNGEGKNI